MLQKGGEDTSQTHHRFLFQDQHAHVVAFRALALQEHASKTVRDQGKTETCTCMSSSSTSRRQDILFMRNQEAFRGSFISSYSCKGCMVEVLQLPRIRSDVTKSAAVM